MGTCPRIQPLRDFKVRRLVQSALRIRCCPHSKLGTMLGFLAYLAWAGFIQGARTQAVSFANLDFVRIEPGQFLMGCSNGDDKCGNDEKPSHSVRITKAFDMEAHQVTEKQWKDLMGRDASSLVLGRDFIAKVSWDEAQSFLNKLNAMKDGYAYRLPTEAEWEFAARNETKKPGMATPVEFANYGDNTQGKGGSSYGPLVAILSESGPPKMVCGDDAKMPPCPGGGHGKPNARGLYDMLGNTPEWAQDYFGPYSQQPQKDPLGPPSGMRKVVRGDHKIGSLSGMEFPPSRVSFRIAWDSNTTELFGFRCVRERK